MGLPIWYRKYFRSIFDKVTNTGYQNWKKKRMLRFYSQFIKPGSLCFDIGANIGNYSRTFLDLEASVIAIEPVDETFQILRHHFSTTDRITFVKAAVSEVTGTSEIHKGDFLELSTLDENFIVFNKTQSNDISIRKQSVDLVTLDELIKTYSTPGFCKIDVEGHELEVLNGLTSIIPVISFEFLFPFKKKSLDCIKRIGELSPLAVFNYSLFEFFELENDDWLDSESFSLLIQELSSSHWTGDIFCKLR
jgi:FkbM family methyltransferase